MRDDSPDSTSFFTRPPAWGSKVASAHASGAQAAQASGTQAAQAGDAAVLQRNAPGTHTPHSVDEHQRTRAALARCEAELRAVYASRSWQLVLRLRAIAAYIRRSPRLYALARRLMRCLRALHGAYRIIRKKFPRAIKPIPGMGVLFEFAPGLYDARPDALHAAQVQLAQLPEKSSIAGQYVCLHGAGRSFAATRTVIVAHDDPQGIVDPYVIHLCRHFKSLGRRVVLAAARKPVDMPTAPAWADALVYRACGGSAFTSWKAALEALPTLRDCAELTLCDDSFLGPLDSFAVPHASLKALDCDFWGMAGVRAACSYIPCCYVVFRQTALRHAAFAEWFARVPVTGTPKDMAELEQRMGLFLAAQGLRAGVFVPEALPESLPQRAAESLAQRAAESLAQRAPLPGNAPENGVASVAYPVSVAASVSASVATPAPDPLLVHWRALLQQHVPFIKKDLLLTHWPGVSIAGCLEELSRRLYPTQLLFRHAWRLDIDTTFCACSEQRSGTWPPDIFVWRKDVVLPPLPAAQPHGAQPHAAQPHDAQPHDAQPVHGKQPPQPDRLPPNQLPSGQLPSGRLPAGHGPADHRAQAGRTPQANPAQTAPGVFFHAYYPERMLSLLPYLHNIPKNAHLYVSTNTEEKARRIRQITQPLGFALCDIRVLPNKGWDIAPFLIGFNDALEQHELIVKLHAKESPHMSAENAALWRDLLFSSLVGSAERVARVIAFFQQNPDFGMLGAPILQGHMHMGIDQAKNHQLMLRCLAPYNIELQWDTAIDFPAASMFWCRTAALRPWLDLDLTFDDFGDTDPAVRDGSPAHAMERLLFFGCAMQGLHWGRLFPVHRQREFCRNF